jgi:RNA polymerase sigma factor (sigma-70 family)
VLDGREPRGQLCEVLRSVTPAMRRAIRRVVGRRHPEEEDIFQEAAIALVRALPAFRGECPLSRFAGRIASLRAASHFRATPPGPTGKAAAHDLGPGQQSPTSLEAVDTALHERRRKAMARALAGIPHRQAEAAFLHYALGFTVDELAAMSAAPVQTVRSRLRLAKAALRTHIASDPRAAELREWGRELRPLRGPGGAFDDSSTGRNTFFSSHVTPNLESDRP